MAEQFELKDEELEQVTGGSTGTNTQSQGQKYPKGTRVRYFSTMFQCDLDGTAGDARWSGFYNQYLYSMSFDDVRIILGGQVMNTGGGGESDVKEQDIKYTL